MKPSKNELSYVPKFAFGNSGRKATFWGNEQNVSAVATGSSHHSEHSVAVRDKKIDFTKIVFEP